MRTSSARILPPQAFNFPIAVGALPHCQVGYLQCDLAEVAHRDVDSGKLQLKGVVSKDWDSSSRSDVHATVSVFCAHQPNGIPKSDLHALTLAGVCTDGVLSLAPRLPGRSELERCTKKVRSCCVPVPVALLDQAAFPVVKRPTTAGGTCPRFPVVFEIMITGATAEVCHSGPCVQREQGGSKNGVDVPHSCVSLNQLRLAPAICAATG